MSAALKPTWLSEDRILWIERHIREARHVDEIWTTPGDVMALLAEVRWWREQVGREAEELRMGKVVIRADERKGGAG